MVKESVASLVLTASNNCYKAEINFDEDESGSCEARTLFKLTK
jgi:hypothetical protein